MKYIDLRSDTVTEPVPEMLRAMVNAEVGDDVYGDDPTVNRLQEIAAGMLGKEDSLFVPSGTFGNQLAILTHTDRGDEIIIPEDNHIILYEVGAYAVIAAAGLRTISSQNGKVDIGELERSFRSHDIHYPSTGLVCVENAHSGGKTVPVANMEEAYRVSSKKDVPVHLDGARVFNAAASLGIGVKEITRYCDSVMVCLSKGLCSPIGSILAGTRAFILAARKNRKLMGGGMRQAGYLAAAGIISLENMTKRLDEDHKNARYLARRLENTGCFKIDRECLDINMVFCRAESGLEDQEKLLGYLLERKIKINPASGGQFRFVTHYWTGRKEIDCFVEALESFIRQTNP
jgi:threonine aldolase